MKSAAVILGGMLLFAASWAGCSQNAVTVPIRSLERSGKAAFLCVRDHGDAPGLPLDECHAVSPPVGTLDFRSAHHVIALVTQTTRGEVAVVDVSASGVVDLNPSVPGFNFLPVGILPTDIVATPGSSAAFVAVADPNRSGIFGISTSRLFPEQNGGQGPTIASLPACGLPAAPSAMVLVRDLSPAAAAGRMRCDGATSPLAPPGYSLAQEAALYGPLKLVVTLPELGQMVVIDAQELLARKPGTFDLCPIDNTLDLTHDVPLSSLASATMAANSAAVASVASAAGVDGGDAGDTASQDEADADADADAGTAGLLCGRKQSARRFGGGGDGGLVGDAPVYPAAMAPADDGRIFVADNGVSAIHVVDASDPCHLSLQAPLLPISRADLGRAVITGALAVSPLTTDLKRFVYAVDRKDNGSVMVFDVSEGSTDRTPLIRPDVVYNQFEPPDRLAFGSAVKSLTFGTQEVPLVASGQVLRGLKCDPKESNDPSSPSYPYRPPPDFISSGAGPRTLRGTFAFLVLANAQVMVVDLDDFDAACRRPSRTDDPRLGCGNPDGRHLSDDEAAAAFLAGSQEVSCKVVERHRARSANYLSNVDAAGRHAPAMLTFPLLRNKDGTVLSVDPISDGAFTRPKLLGPCLGGNACSCSAETTKQPPVEDTFLANVSGGTYTAADFCPKPYPPRGIDPGTAMTAMGSDSIAKRNWVALDLKEPRAHIDQAWSITFEGILSPWFGVRRGRMEGADPHLTLVDSDAGFCDHGAQGADLAVSQGIATGDIVQILDALPDPADPYWATVSKTCTPAVCTAQYGTPEKPVAADPAEATSRGLAGDQTWLRRDLLVKKSFQDRLELEASFVPLPQSNAPPPATLACCFPYPVTYAVRGGSQWVVNGSVVSFEHHLIPDPNAADSSTAACVVSCDPNLSLRNGRVARRASGAPVPDVSLNPTDPTVFRNQALQFVVWDPADLKCDGPCLQRDMAFSFQEVGGFTPLLVSLSSNAYVMPQSISFVPGLSQLAIPDATSQGLILFDLRRIATTQTIF